MEHMTCLHAGLCAVRTAIADVTSAQLTFHQSIMADPFEPYRGKRDFKITKEPRGAGRRSHKAPPSGQNGLSFVIQKHAARRLHYDFRLELDGALKSWAVPKGPSLDPKDKRMAVHVEDHPMAYANFEGMIPPRQYGAGTVIIWDHGQWLPDGDPHAGYRAGKLKFELKGKKLSGHWTLVRIHGRANERQDTWLLIKENDASARAAAEYDVLSERPESVISHSVQKAPNKVKAKAEAQMASSPKGALRRCLDGATPSPLPLTLSPQLAVLVDKPPTAGDWVYEIKYDGYRLLARVDKKDVKLFTREGHDWTTRMKGLAQALKAMRLPPAWLDGEIIVQDPDGIPDFQLLQNAFDTSHTQNICYMVFDLPYVNGYDLRQVPLAMRRELLQELLVKATPADAIQFSQSLTASADVLLEHVCKMQMEGLIGKRAQAPYSSSRSPDWIKLKCTQRQEFVIGGYTAPKGSRVGFGALLLGVYDAHGSLHHVGNVGTGFSQASLTALRDKLDALRAPSSPFAHMDKDAHAHWVKPKLVADIAFAGWTREARLRQAVFHGLRSDKPANVVTRENAMSAHRLAASHPAPAKGQQWPALTGLKLTHADRVIDRSSGITKLELAQYYAKVADRILPHLKRRPVSMVRGPDGIDGELFFQKHGDKLKIPGIKLLETALNPDHPSLLEVDTEQALLGSVQMNVMEFHTWNARTSAIDKPDRMVFDLDPGEGVSWSLVQEAAELVHVLLDSLHLQSYLKTSGGKGLHVVVPLTPAMGWDAVKGASQVVVNHLARVIPDRFVNKSGPRNRIGKIYVDYLRNGRGATTAAAWSARARPGMGVSVPVSWSELSSLTGGAHWTIRSIDERLAMANDPWQGYSRTRVSLKQAIKALTQVQALP